MRYVAVLLITSMPLGFVTVSSFLQMSSSGASNSSTGRPLDPAAASKLLAEGAAGEKQIKDDAELLHDLVESDLFEAPSEGEANGGLSVPAAGSPLSGISDPWRQADQARRLAAEYAAQRIHKSLVDSSMPEGREAVLARLLAFLATGRALGAVVGASPLFARLESQIETLKSQIEADQRGKRIVDAVDAAEAAVVYDPRKCLQILSGDPLNKGPLPSDVQTKVELLRTRATFRAAAMDVLRNAGLASTIQDLNAALERIDDFLAMHSSPPTPTEDLQHREVSRMRGVVMARIEINGLGTPTPENFDRYLDGAAALIATRNLDPAVRRELRDQVANVLTNSKAFQKPSMVGLDVLNGKQEGITKSNMGLNSRRLIGYFRRRTDDASYKFWENEADRDDPAKSLGDRQVPLDGFEVPPGTPKILQWATDYNRDVTALVSNIASGDQDRWRRFADKCASLRQEMEAYQQRWGIKNEADKACSEWDFSGAESLARKVANKWESFRRVMDN